MASSGGTTSGSGVLTNLEFEVLGTPGMTTTLEISSATLNDGAIPTATASGIFTVSLVYDVSGSVLFWSGSAGVPGVGLTLEGDHLYTASSEGDGSFTVSDVPEDDYTLTPKKDDEANGISAYDGSLVLQHAAGLITLSGHQATAADVNKSGSISSMDAFYILQKAVLLINVPFPGAGVVWEFDPAERSYSNLSSDQTGQDFTALLLGDVSGNWSTGGDLPQGIHNPTGETDSMTATLSLAQVSVLPGETVSLPLSLDLPQGNVYGVDLIVAYDPAVVSVLDIQKGALADGWSLVSNNKTPGIIRIAMAGSGAISSGGELLSLDLEAIGDIDSDTVITMTVGELNEGGIPTMLENGLVQIVASQQVDLFLPLIAKQ
jgi:hypothetical protein